MLDITFMKAMNPDDPHDELLCIPGTTFRSTLYNAVSEVIFITNPAINRILDAIARIGLLLE